MPPGTPVKREIAEATLDRDPYCVVCGRHQGEFPHLHHRKLRKHGGPDCPSNLLALHSACHSWVHMHPKAAYEKGYLVPSWAEPQAWPLQLPSGETVRLAPTGAYQREMKENENVW